MDYNSKFFCEKKTICNLPKTFNLVGLCVFLLSKSIVKISSDIPVECNIIYEIVLS